jgi:hypothetical protein
MDIDIPTYMYIYIYIYTCIDIFMYTYIYTYINTQGRIFVEDDFNGLIRVDEKGYAGSWTLSEDKVYLYIHVHIYVSILICAYTIPVYVHNIIYSTWTRSEDACVYVFEYMVL